MLEVYYEVAREVDLDLVPLGLDIPEEHWYGFSYEEARAQYAVWDADAWTAELFLTVFSYDGSEEKRKLIASKHWF